MIVVFWSWISDVYLYLYFPDGLNSRNSSVRTVRWWDTQAWQERYQNGSDILCNVHPSLQQLVCNHGGLWTRHGIHCLLLRCVCVRVKMNDWADCVWHVANYPRCPSHWVDLLSGYVEDTSDHYYYWLLQMIYQLDTIELCQQLIVHLYTYVFVFISLNIPNMYIYI